MWYLWHESHAEGVLTVVRPAAAAAGGVNKSRWRQQHGGAQTDRDTDRQTDRQAEKQTGSGHVLSHVPCWGEFAPRQQQQQQLRAAILKVTLIQAATVQLSGTMTEDDGFCCRGGICQTPRWKKGV